MFKRNWALLLSVSMIILFFSCKKNIDLPTAAFSVTPENGNINAIFTFDASPSYKGEGTEVVIKEYYWDFNGDGVWDTVCKATPIVHYHYVLPGNKTVILKVRNSQGYVSVTTRTFVVADYVNNPPSKPSNPIPANNATGQLTQLVLSWNCSDPDGDPVVYKIFFGDSADPPLVSSDLSETSYDTGTLEAGKTYYWKIIASDNHSNNSESAIWHFRTQGSVQQCPTTLFDERDGKSYTTVVIGQQCWMAENIDIGEMIISSTSASNQADNEIIEKYCYGNSQVNCNLYGGLYQWNEMMNYTEEEGSQGICPVGWHVPTESEWSALVEYLGGNLYAAIFLKDGGSAGFNALLGGERLTDGSFANKGTYVYFWSSTSKETGYAFQIHMLNTFNAVFYTYDEKVLGKSVRCLMD
ncbi:MAG: PKD domain-containing protein [Lentimicrobiaceae bacterium]|nr:PKD domain-containing protein [Lentimicrobiaceae bacterium]